MGRRSGEGEEGWEMMGEREVHKEDCQVKRSGAESGGKARKVDVAELMVHRGGYGMTRRTC